MDENNKDIVSAEAIQEAETAKQNNHLRPDKGNRRNGPDN